jgi:hypothetical protein
LGRAGGVRTAWFVPGGRRPGGSWTRCMLAWPALAQVGELHGRRGRDFGRVARTWMAAREGLGAGPGGRKSRRSLRRGSSSIIWRRTGAVSSPASHFIRVWPRPRGAGPEVFMPAQGGAGWTMRSRGTSFHQLPAGLAHRDPRAAGPRDPFGARPQSRSRAAGPRDPFGARPQSRSRAAGPCDPFGARPQSRSRAAALATQRGTPHQQHQHHGQRCGSLLPHISRTWCTLTGRFVRFACTRSVISGRRSVMGGRRSLMGGRRSVMGGDSGVGNQGDYGRSGSERPPRGSPAARSADRSPAGAGG